MKPLLDGIWTLLNSPVGISLIAMAALYLLNRVYAKKPTWQRFEGAIISAIKYAEKAIPDDATNKAAARLDTALRYVLKVFGEVEGRRATSTEEAEIRDAISVVHASLEADGNLDKTPTPTEAGT